ncbi:MAG: response regulator [Subdoligranulum sp.]
MLHYRLGGWNNAEDFGVEDDIDIQDILKNHLIDAGYEVAVASDGVTGIAMFDDTIDLVLLDIMLPKIDGYGVC